MIISLIVEGIRKEITMYKGKKISVAVATYNGEKYIREQIDSILNQTVIPDEIVISDDGSKDRTLEIIQEIADSGHNNISIYTDNPHHGFAFNFGHAISRCTGDVLFLCDQDDIWHSQKVEHIVDVYNLYPDALCVFHNAVSVDSDGKPNNVLFNSFIQSLADKHSAGEIVKIPGNPYCEVASSGPQIHGLVMSVSRELLNTAFPFPPISSQHDGWLWFCAEALDGCYYLNEILTKRRLHTENTSGAGEKGFDVRRIKKVFRNIERQNDIARTRILYAQYMKTYIETYCTKDNVGAMRAFSTISRVYEIGYDELSAASSGRLSGAIKLTKLYLKDIRYRRSGGKIFLYELADILLRSKKNRVKSIEQMMK